MIYNYRERRFIDDGRPNQLMIEGLAVVHMPAHTPVAFVAENAGPDEAIITKTENPIFRFEDGVLKVFSDGQRVRDLTKVFFVMSESEISSSQRELYSRSQVQDEGLKKLFDEDTKKIIQKCIDDMAVANGIAFEDIGYFNDRMIMYMYPLIRTVANKQTNFHKVIEDLKVLSEAESSHARVYKISAEMLDQRRLTDALREYLGTGSKQIMKFISHRFIKKTDLVKSLSPELLDILTKNSSKIFGIAAETKILTCYEDIMFDSIPYVKYIMDIFEGNVDYTQTFLNSKENHSFGSTNVKIMSFLKKHFSPQTRMQILLENDNYTHQLNDVVNQFDEYSNPESIPWKLRPKYPNGLELPRSWKTLKELHDKVSIDYNEIKAEDNNKSISYDAVEWGIHGMKEGNIELMLPSEGKTLVEWGSEQNHCVASYADRAARKECVIVGVKINGKHLYTMELRVDRREIPVKPGTPVGSSAFEEPVVTYDRITKYNYSIRQFYGYKNHTPEAVGDNEIRLRVKKMLNEVFKVEGVDDGLYTDNQLDALNYALQAGNYNQNIAIGEVPPAIIQNVAAE